jgi:hypothetical protein
VIVIVFVLDSVGMTMRVSVRVLGFGFRKRVARPVTLGFRSVDPRTKRRNHEAFSVCGVPLWQRARRCVSLVFDAFRRKHCTSEFVDNECGIHAGHR